MENEAIEGELDNVNITRGWSGVLVFDVLFTDKGMLFRRVGETVTRTSSSGLSIGGINTTQVSRLIKKVADPKNESTRNVYQGLSVEQMLNMDKKNFYVKNDSVSSVSMKKKMVGGAEMCFETSDGKIKCDLPAEKMEPARTLVSKRLGSKFVQ